MKKIAKIINSLDNIVNIIMSLFFLLILLIGFYTMYDTLIVYSAANGDDLRTYRPNIVNKDEAEWDMSEISKDVVAWITIDGTNIDYPIMQGHDNSEYLNKDPFGNYSLSGSIFLDSRNSPDFSDPYSLVYGHHMDYGKMFGALDDFADNNYFDNHRTGTLTIGNSVYTLEFFAFLNTDGSTEEIFVPGIGERTLEFVREHASIFYEPINGRLIALSTCKSPYTTERTILFGVITK